jgi:uncharacterized repeat protein (TIGR01451 family)
MLPSQCTTRLLSGLAAVFFALTAQAGTADRVAETSVDASTPRASTSSEPGDVQVGIPTGRYFVKLRQPSLVQQLARERAAAGTQWRLSLRSGDALDREAAIRRTQSAALTSFARTLARPVTPALTYAKAFNGFSLELSEREAALLAADPAVMSVRPVLAQPVASDVGPTLIGAPALWDGSATGLATSGEGITIGILDTGINSNHPSFAATADGYTHVNPLGAGQYLGWCATPENAGFCNDKLIGAYDFVFPLVQGNPNVLEEESPEDNHGHGSHTAGTAAGNPITATVATTPGIRLSGVAPRASIVAFDVCYFWIPDNRNYCLEDASLAAIESAITDGVVSVLNFSISGGVDPYTDAVAEAFLAATEMGIYVAAAAGNNGPAVSTLSHQAPWIATTAASSHGRRFGGVLSATGPGTPPANTVGQLYLASSGVALTTPLTAPLIDAFAVDQLNPGACTPFSGTPFANRIVLIQYDGCSASVKVANAQAAGALAVVAYSQFAGSTFSLSGLTDPALTTPAVTITVDSGLALKQFMTAQPGVTVTLGAVGSVIFGVVDEIARFSSRGPNSRIDVLKPDLAAPGVSVLAAYADGRGTGVPGNEVSLSSGTSMASPHHAGAAALLQVVHPDWTPMQIRSALMLTAKSSGLVNEPGSGQSASPFTYGNGRLRVAEAAASGLVMDESIAAFEAADPALNGDPRTLNLASLYSSRCVNRVNCSFARRFTNPRNAPSTWNVTFQSPTGVVMSAQPPSFTVAPGETVEVIFSADATALAPASGFRFGEVILTHAAGTLAPLHLGVALRTVEYSMPDRWTFTTARDAGARRFESLAVPQASNLTFLSSGLVRGTQVTQLLAQDSDTLPYNALGLVYHTLLTPTQDAARLVVQITASEARNLDLFVGRDNNGDGLPQTSEQIASATSGTALETVDLRNLAATSNYWILVQSRRGTGEPDEFTLSYGWVPRTGADNLNVDAPSTPTPGAEFAATLSFDEPAMAAGERWYGVFEIGSDPQNAALAQYGTLAVNVIRTADDVVKSADRSAAAAGDVVTYTVDVAPNSTSQALQYAIADTLPTGLTLLPNSAQASTGTVAQTGNSVQWTLQTAASGFDAATGKRLSGASAALTYQATVDSFVGEPRTLTNIAQHATDALGTREEVASASIVVSGAPTVPEIFSDGFEN